MPGSVETGSMKSYTIENRFLSLSIDDKGRIVSLANKLTHTELIKYPSAAEAWRMILATGRHTRDIVLGSGQEAPEVRSTDNQAVRSIEVFYESVAGEQAWRIRARFIFSLEDGSDEILVRAEVENRCPVVIEEVEFPVVGGIGGYSAQDGRSILDLVAAGDRGDFHPDILNEGLPDTGRESNHFVREHETSMFETDWGGVWLDLYCEEQGLFLGYLKGRSQFAFKLEKFPKEVPSAGAHCYPKGTPRWTRAFGVHVPRIQPGQEWRSEPVRIVPHKGDWHAAAGRYSEFRHSGIKVAEQPEWMKDFVGWTEILGKTYLGEVYHDYARCADAVIKDKQVTGIDLVFYYGHTRLGAEGADFDHSPDPALGGEQGFREMVEKLHRNGVRIILLDHFHRWINRDIAEYEGLSLEKHAVLDVEGRPRTARWWKETYLSCRRLEGPTPVWIEMCPASDKWLEYYLDHVTRMIRLGVDGLELDTFESSACYSGQHNHRKGTDVFEVKMEFMREVRSHAKGLNPDFVLIGENMIPETREVLDGFYSSRYLTECERIYQYMFPDMRHQSVLVGNYAYDQVNKALSLGVGIDTEIWGLRKTTLEGCPELAQYIGEVNRFKREYADVMMRGEFRDTVGAKVKGDCLYSVLKGPGKSKAVVLRNPHRRSVEAQAWVDDAEGLTVTTWKPFAEERATQDIPVRASLGPFEVLVVLATERGVC
jgi:hypothetical protein